MTVQEWVHDPTVYNTFLTGFEIAGIIIAILLAAFSIIRAMEGEKWAVRIWINVGILVAFAVVTLIATGIFVIAVHLLGV